MQVTPQLWQELHYYEVMDALKIPDEQISHYVARYRREHIKEEGV